ncbi:hypothetical protein TNCV_65681 [Trichonephila clavipes]|nr:hypothetical protein TNCV_65681 [Trichonephila clavipes]
MRKIHNKRKLILVDICDCEDASLQTSIDEAHFWLNGYVNKQNCRIWSEANPQGYVETPLHPEKLTVYGLVESFFKKDEGHNVTVNGDCIEP